MLLQKKDIKKSNKVRVYTGVSYVVKSINDDGTFVVNAFDEYDDGTQRLRIGNAIVRFSRNLFPPTLKVGEKIYGVEATAILDSKLGKRVYVINSFSKNPITIAI